VVFVTSIPDGYRPGLQTVQPCDPAEAGQVTPPEVVLAAMLVGAGAAAGTGGGFTLASGSLMGEAG